MATITPEYLARSNTEDAHQIAVICWAWQNREQYPQLAWLHHIPNGGQRNKIVAAKLKQMGVRKGIPDLFLPWPCGNYHGLYIEMKKPDARPVRERTPGTKPAGASDEQWQFGQYATENGYGWIVCYSWEEAVAALKSYMDYKT